jgi:steroid delta-isomerase-like uncharacterized protein
MGKIEEDKAIIRRFSKEVWNEGNMEVFKEVFASNFVYHDPAAPKANSLEDYRQFVSRIRTTWPDMHYTIEDMIAEGDKVVARYTWLATHQKVFRGIPPTGRQVTHPGIAIYRFAGDKVVELWDIWDALGLYQQIGLVEMKE